MSERERISSGSRKMSERERISPGNRKDRREGEDFSREP